MFGDAAKTLGVGRHALASDFMSWLIREPGLSKLYANHLRLAVLRKPGEKWNQAAQTWMDNSVCKYFQDFLTSRPNHLKKKRRRIEQGLAEQLQHDSGAADSASPSASQVPDADVGVNLTQSTPGDEQQGASAEMAPSVEVTCGLAMSAPAAIDPVDVICIFGFARPVAVSALAAAGGDVDQAIDHLFRSNGQSSIDPVDAICALGFPRGDAIAALEEAGGNVDRAAEALFLSGTKKTTEVVGDAVCTVSCSNETLSLDGDGAHMPSEQGVDDPVAKISSFGFAQDDAVTALRATGSVNEAVDCLYRALEMQG